MMVLLSPQPPHLWCGIPLARSCACLHKRSQLLSHLQWFNCIACVAMLRHLQHRHANLVMLGQLSSSNHMMQPFQSVACEPLFACHADGARLGRAF